MTLAHASFLAAVGHQVVIKTNQVDTVFDLDPLVRIEKPRYPGAMGTLIAAALERFDADRVIADIIPLVALLLLRNRDKLIYFAQDYDESYYKNLVQKLLIRSLYLVALRLAGVATLSVSDRLGELLRRRFRARVREVGNGIDAGLFYPDPDPALADPGTGRFSVLLLSRGDQRKGFDVAVRALEILRDAGSASVEVWTVGEPATGKFPGLRHRDFGYLGEAELRRVLSSADCFLYPTRHEGFGLMVLEAMACRCPVVTTAAVPFAVDGENVLLCGIDDPVGAAGQLRRLHCDGALRLSLAGEGERLAARLTLDAASRRFAHELVTMQVRHER